MTKARLKIKAPDQDSYRALLALLRGRGEVRLASAQRHFVVVASLPDDLTAAALALGCTIAPDHHYELER